MTITPKRRWVRFSLRTFLVAVAIAGLLTWRLAVAHQHRAFYAKLEQQGVTVRTWPYTDSPAEQWIHRVKESLGYETVYEVTVNYDKQSPRPSLKADLVTMRSSETVFFSVQHGCGQLLNIDELPD